MALHRFNSVYKDYPNPICAQYKSYMTAMYIGYAVGLIVVYSLNSVKLTPDNPLTILTLVNIYVIIQYIVIDFIARIVLYRAAYAKYKEHVVNFFREEEQRQEQYTQIADRINAVINQTVVVQQPRFDLSYETITKIHQYDLPTKCQVCLTEYLATDDMQTLACGHYFHKDCIEVWVKSGKQCPLCRK
jgi:xanthosine utilization system XapX-like protein